MAKNTKIDNMARTLVNIIQLTPRIVKDNIAKRQVQWGYVQTHEGQLFIYSRALDGSTMSLWRSPYDDSTLIQFIRANGGAWITEVKSFHDFFGPTATK